MIYCFEQIFLIKNGKLFKINLPEYDKIREELRMSAEEKRSKAAKEGIAPPVSFEYRPLNITTSGEILDPYIPVSINSK